MHARWFRFGLVVAVVLRIVTLWVVSQHPERAMSEDSPLYLELGRHFSQAYVNADQDFRWSSVVRTPGYPLFCHLWMRLFGDSVASILVAQHVLSLVCVAVVYVLANRLVSAAAARWAALLVAMDPLAITYANLIRNEVLFTAVLTVSILAWHASLVRPRALTIVTTGALFGLSVLVRPVATYLIVVLLPADLWLRRRRGATALVSAWMVLGFLTPVGGWAARNHEVVGQAVVSSIEDLNLLYYRVAGAIAEETGEPHAVVARRLGSLTRSTHPGLLDVPVEDLPLQSNRATILTLLAQHPYGAAMSTLRGLGRLLFEPGAIAFNDLLLPERSDTHIVVSLMLVGYLSIMYVSVGAGIMSLIEGQRKEPLILLGAVVLYTALISSGPEAYSRFRAPLMPLFAIVAGGGLASLSRSAVESVTARSETTSTSESRQIGR
jgi:4-amino-4-deoxy-L-arabinose transferase-like glycosyltransferase